MLAIFIVPVLFVTIAHFITGRESLSQLKEQAAQHE
jgi:hypothetical protein